MLKDTVGFTKRGITKQVLVLILIHALVVIVIGAFTLWTRNIWNFFFVIPFITAIWLGFSIRHKNQPGFIVLTLLIGLSLSTIVLVLPLFSSAWPIKIRLALVFAGLPWIAIWLLSRKLFPVVLWWPIIPGAVLCGGALGFTFSSMQFFDYLFFVGTSLGAGLLIWGIGKKLFGLIIAGSLVLTVSPGIAFSWKWITPVGVLSQIGIMLVWFALGWALITIASRVVTDKFIWWPLIPAGVLAMVGMGLYMGGNPTIASAVLSNSGAMGIILFGLYLTLMRWRVKR
jgi:hypothetical protein